MDFYKKLLNPNCEKIKFYDGAANNLLKMEDDKDLNEGEDYDEDEEMENENYADEFKRIENERYAASMPVMQRGAMTEVSSVCDLMDDVKPSQQMLHEYDNFNISVSQRNQDLLIDKYKEQIISLTKTHMVIVIQGPTGCGKSTQVPQFILDDCYKNKQPCNIVVTQPRKIAAISLARRVCEERCWSYGSYCGYQIGLEKNVSPQTKITYVTTGVLLQKIITGKNLNEFSHIIIDEVHERTQEMDFLLIIVRKFLNLNSPTVKVVLMSATFDSQKFSHYFRTYFQEQEHRAPTIHIDNDNQKRFEVQEYYLDALSPLGEIPNFDDIKESPKLEKSLLEILVVLLTAFDRLEKKNDATNELIDIGNVLIFLPGIMEIEEVYRKLQADQHKVDHVKWYLVPLHSTISLEEQKLAFLPPPPNQRKIILSTNIAESSITVPDIGYVIDFCLTKAMVIDPQTNYHRLKLIWASKDNCIQRAGRVGRVRSGRVYRFVPKRFYVSHMEETLKPEMLRAPLETTILFSKMLGLPEPPHAILALALDPPELRNIQYSIKILKETGGLLTTCKGIPMKSDGDLTFLGRIMSSLPLDIKLSKLIVMGYMFNCLQQCIIMAAGCSLSNIFTFRFMEALKMYSSRLIWANDSQSDLISLLHLYSVWSRNRNANTFGSGSNESKWAKNNYVSLRAIREWNYLINEISHRLEGMGIRNEGESSSIIRSELYPVLKICIAGAFYPHYFKRTQQIDENEAKKEIGGFGLKNTVYFKNMELGHPGVLYAKQIKSLFEGLTDQDMKIHFDNSMKIYVEFLRDMKMMQNASFQQMSGTVAKNDNHIFNLVYRAVKQRKLNMKHILNVLPKEQAWKYAEEHGIKNESSLSSMMINNIIKSEIDILEETYTEFVPIVISQVINAGHFWAQRNCEQTMHALRDLEMQLNHNICLDKLTVTPFIGQIVVGLFTAANMYYRCRVINLEPHANRMIARVLFIDYGNTEEIDVKELKALPTDDTFKRPPLAFECQLCGIKPSMNLNLHGFWSARANEIVNNLTFSDCYARIYSIVSAIVRLEIYKTLDSENRVSLNQYLLDKAYAQDCEEMRISRENHQARIIAAKTPKEEFNRVTHDVPEPPKEMCHYSINLKGPYSPLEMQIYNYMRDKVNRTIFIDKGSVNSVLLDEEPTDAHERLIVAAQINQNASDNLSLRETTVMPNKPGFPMLMAMMFCPDMEVKSLPDGSRFGQILCGLGTFEEDKPVYAEHDISITLDTELSNDDIEQVNEIRYRMNIIIEHMENKANHIPSDINIRKIQEELHEYVFKLIDKKRRAISPMWIKGGDIWRRHAFMGRVMQPGEDAKAIGKIWPLHWSMLLREGTSAIEDIKRNIEEMKDIATKTVPFYEVTCKACGVTLQNVSAIRVHLVSNAHVEKVRLI